MSKTKVIQLIQGAKQYTPFQTQSTEYLTGYIKLGGNDYPILQIKSDTRDKNWLHVYISDNPVSVDETSLEEDFYFNPMDWNKWQELQAARNS